MNARTTIVTRLIRLLPASLVASLDAWSYRVAQRRAQLRREAGLRRMQVGKIAH